MIQAIAQTAGAETQMKRSPEVKAEQEESKRTLLNFFSW